MQSIRDHVLRPLHHSPGRDPKTVKEKHKWHTVRDTRKDEERELARLLPQTHWALPCLVSKPKLFFLFGPSLRAHSKPALLEQASQRGLDVDGLETRQADNGGCPEGS